MSFSGFATFTQMALYGKKYFRQPAYQKLRKTWQKEGTDMLDNANLYDMASKVCMVTGSNSGIGKEIAEYLAKRGACVYMVCRNPERGAKARQDIVDASGNENVHLMVCDVSLKAQVHDMWGKFLDHRASIMPSSVEGTGGDRSAILDVLVCNAGALLNDKTVTSEGVEATFASHLVFGTHLLGRLAMPSLERTAGSRLVITTSGGMYGSKAPAWDRFLAREPEKKYNGILAYAYAKRGQVIVAEEWAKLYPQTKIVTAHPGWTKTPGTGAAFGDNEKYLNPMRTAWEGACGICYLCCCDADTIESGAFYLDRSTQPKHISGPFFTEGSYTKNSPAEVAFLMNKLDEWNFGSGIEVMPTEEKLCAQAEVLAKPLKEMEGKVDTQKFMGRWYVVSGVPTMFEQGAVNPTEVYKWNEVKQTVEIEFYMSKNNSSKVSVFQQRAKVNNLEVGTRWALSPKIGPFYAPLNIGYLILYCNEDYSETVIGVPNRDYVWIMARTPTMSATRKAELVEMCGQMGYNRTKIIEYDHTHDLTDDQGNRVDAHSAGA